MQAFRDYLISEYKEQAKGFVAVEFKFSHNVNLKADKASKKGTASSIARPIRVDIIKVNMKFVDRNLDVLHTASIQFENNVIPKTKAKQLVNIAPKELEVKFGFAKKEICKVIHDELNEKSNELKLRLNNLESYIGSSGIIPTEFKGEAIKIEETEQLIPFSLSKKIIYNIIELFLLISLHFQLL